MFVILFVTFIICFLIHRQYYSNKSLPNSFCENLDCVRCSPVYSSIKSSCERKTGKILKNGQVWMDSDLPELAPFPDLSVLLDDQQIDELERAVGVFREDFEQLKLENLKRADSKLGNETWVKKFIMNQGTWTDYGKTTKTIKILKSILGEKLILANNVFGNVLFSTVTDKISAHYGPTNIRVRLQICLEADDRFEIVCGEERKKWTRNGMFLLNDWLMHEVEMVNGKDPGLKSMPERSVLIVDLCRNHAKKDDPMLSNRYV